MKKRCTPRLVIDLHAKKGSWRKAAKELNEIYGVDLPHLTWRDYATRRRDIVNVEIRAALLLGPRACPPSGNFSRLLRRLDAKDLRRWLRLRKQRKYMAAQRLLDEVYNRK
jgi:hypothetical protein